MIRRLRPQGRLIRRDIETIASAAGVAPTKADKSPRVLLSAASQTWAGCRRPGPVAIDRAGPATRASWQSDDLQFTRSDLRVLAAFTSEPARSPCGAQRPAPARLTTSSSGP